MSTRFFLAAGGAIAIAACVGGTGGGGWDQTGWFGSEDSEDAGHGGFPDVTLPPGAGGGGPGGGPGGGAQPHAPSCGTQDCNASEVCVQAASGLTCAPTCINAVSCVTGCCAQSNGIGYCAPKSSCCGDTGSNCADGQICVTPPHGQTECADTCASSKDCSKTLCCATLKNDAGACLYMSEVNGTCKP